MVSPTLTPPIRPGPAAAAIPSSAPNGSCASFIALAMIESSTSTWARAAISGTTPPNAACSLICERTTFDRMRPCPSAFLSTTAAAVSSQVVSMPRTIIGVYMVPVISGPSVSTGPKSMTAIVGACFVRTVVMGSGEPLHPISDMRDVSVTLEGHRTESASAVPFLRIGSRGSPLTLVQAREVQGRLAAAAGVAAATIEIKVIRTTGDVVQDRPLADAGGKGLFTKEIEEALSSGAIDLAVHSSKDMPTVLPAGLELSAFLPREDARDAFIGREVKSLRELPHGAVIGTASLRRQAMVKHL